jgi:hypothetical protein
MTRLWRVVGGLVLLLPLAGEARAAPAAACAPTRQVIARGFGSPDDLARGGATTYFTDVNAGVLASLSGGHVHVIARGLSTPEGIVLESAGRALVVEQGLNRIDDVNLSTGHWSVVLQLTNTTGLEGVDGIGPAPGGAIYVPDSPYGSLWLLTRRRHLQRITSGLGRPVDAIAYNGGIAVADETANAIWLIRGGRTTRLATVPTPDDVIVAGGDLLAVTLGDGALWEIAPHLRRLMLGLGQPQGLVAVQAGSVLVADSPANTLVKIARLSGCLR